MTNYDLDANQLRAARILLGWDLKDSERTLRYQRKHLQALRTYRAGRAVRDRSQGFGNLCRPPGLSSLGAASALEIPNRGAAA